MGLCASDQSKSEVAEQKPPLSDAATPASNHEPPPAKAHAWERVLDNETRDVTEQYSMGNVVGAGGFGITRRCFERATGEAYACKTISKRKLRSRHDREDVRREVQILHHLGGHPHITQLKGVFEGPQSVHLVMELCSGGELFDRIVSRGRYSEKDAAVMCRTIVKVIGHCHSLGVIHRDLKPENFLLESPADDSPLKACDFGLSKFFRPGEVLTDLVGSPFYIAPEVWRRRYGKEADIWSAGVILYVLLCGAQPFRGDTDLQIQKAVRYQQVDMSDDPWPHISDDAKDCVRRMLDRDAAKRATADEILQHPWMREHGTASSVPLDNIVLRRMRGFSAMNRLKRQAIKCIADSMDPGELAGLRALFQAFDADGSGMITVQQMEQALRKQGSVVEQEELDRLVAALDADRSGAINYAEFVAATVSLSALQQQENLRLAFDQLDCDSSGFITGDNLQAALAHGDEDISDEIAEIIKECDKAGDGRIDYEEFVAMMTSGNEVVLQSQSTMRRTRGGRKIRKALKVLAHRGRGKT